MTALTPEARAKLVSDLRNGTIQRGTIWALQAAATALTADGETIARLTAENARLTSERPYIVGWNHGFDEANYQAEHGKPSDGDLSPQHEYTAAEFDAVSARAEAAEARVKVLEEAKDGAYLERNKLVALIASLFPSGIKKTAIEGWSEDWHGCVYIDLPCGQASWHYHDSQAPMFAHLPTYQGVWDGHTTDQKYDRIVLAALKGVKL